MEKQKISLIAIAVFSISLLFVFDFHVKPAYAQSFQVITNFAHPIIAMHYQVENDLIWILSGNTTNGKTVLYWVDRDTLSVVGSFNHTVSVQGGVTNRASDIWCGKTDCYISTSNPTHSVNGQILRISTEDISPNIFRGQNVTGTYTHSQSIYHITGRDAVSGGFGSVTIWADACTTDPASCDDEIHIIDGISMLFVQDLKDFGFASNDWRAWDMVWSGIAGVTDNDLAIVHSSVNIGTIESRLYVMNLATITQHCSVQTPTISAVLSRAISLDTNYFSAGDSNNKIYVGTNGGHIFVYSNDCVLQQTIDATETGISGNVRYLEYDSGRIFFQEDGASAPLVQMLTNSSGHIIETSKQLYLPLPSSSQAVFDPTLTRLTIGDMILFSGFGNVWFPYTGTDKKVGILQYDSSPPDEPPTTGVDCELPENANILICRLGGDGTLGSAGAFVIGNTTSGTGILGIGCSIGLVDCTEDSDPRTNGLGLLIFIASIFVIVGMFYRSLGASETWHMPVFIWVIIIVALSAFFTITEIIDPIFLVLSIIAVIALAVPKVVGMIQSRGFGGGGSTE